jgi:GcrA cell cycle regulator
MSWTDERIELLKVLWASGLSGGQIAAELGGITRNSVIGKVHRLGLPQRGSPVSACDNPRAPRHPRSHKPDTRRIAELQAVAMQADETSNLPPDQSRYACGIMELTSETCRFPLGDPGTPGFAFCGAKPEPACPYCRRHALIAYSNPSQRRQEVAEWAARQGMRRVA